VREAAIDLYYNSWRFLAANILFGVILIVLLFSLTSTVWAWALVIALIPPAAGCLRMATTRLRDGHTDLGEFAAVLRRPWFVLGLGLGQLAVLLVIIVDFMVGIAVGSFFGGVLAVSALWGLVIGWAYVMVAWPILMDPLRDSEPLRARLRLAGLLLLAHPLRIGALAILAAAFLIVSTIAIAAIVTVSLAYTMLVLARYILPAADRLEGRATEVVESPAG
jgi:hypothetical protein